MGGITLSGSTHPTTPNCNEETGCFVGPAIGTRLKLDSKDGSMKNERLAGSIPATLTKQRPNIGALIIRIRFWGPLYYNFNQEPPKIV